MKRAWSTLVALSLPSLLLACGSAPDDSGSTADEITLVPINGPILTLPSATIEVINTKTSTDALKKVVLVPDTMGAGQSELGTTLANNQLGMESSHVAFTSAYSREELLVFARDPSEHAETTRLLMTNQAASPIGLGGYGLSWSFQERTMDGIAGDAVALPRVVSLVNPSARELCFGPCSSDYDGAGSWWAFWGPTVAGHTGTPASTVAGLAAPNGKGSVKGLALYDHGICSQEVPFSDLLGGKLDDIWTQVKASVDSEWDVDYGTRIFQGVTSYVAHATGTPTDLHGGFVVASQFFLRTYLGSNISIDFSTQYGLKLTNGILDAAPWVWLHVSGSDDVFNTFADKLGNQAPADVRSEARARQIAPVPATTLAVAKLQLQIGLALAKTPLNLTDADESALDALITNSANWTGFDASTGACTAGTAANPACNFIVRAKRVNVFPNTVELVFADGKETSNPTYALYAALYGSDYKQGTTLLSQLCTRSFQAGGGSVNAAVDWTLRDYYQETRGSQTYDP